MKIKVFNADDHPMLRKGVSDLLSATEEFEWLGSAENGEEAYHKIKAMQPDVAILDIEMPKMTGIEAAKKLISEGVSTQFIMLTLFSDSSFFNNALSLGINGYLLKESSEKEIIDCIKTVASGQPYVTPSLTKHLIQKNRMTDNVLSKLSSHEINILKLIAMQKTSAQIADMLFISPKTVSNHRSNISKKLNLSGEQNGLLKWALQNQHLLST